MSSFDYDTWYRTLELTDQWLLEWRAHRNLSLKEIAAKSGLPKRTAAVRLLRLRHQLIARMRAAGSPD